MKDYILITGVAGNIGSSLALSLLKKNYNIIGIDNFLTGKKKSYQINHIEISNLYLEMLIIKKKSLIFLNLIKLNLYFIFPQ
jgi:nucleoside-diphosphate-sugar epimerase